jgi:DNA modification methylase
MTPYYADPWLTVYAGDCRAVMAEMPERSVHCVVTSPPYWGLRDYGTATWVGGDPTCDHRHETRHQQQGATSQRAGRSNVEDQRNENFRDVCGKCGAARVDGQIGLEPTPEAYVETMVAVFREVRRVLRDDGTVWLNLGDSYAGARSEGGGTMAGFNDRYFGRSTDGGKQAETDTSKPSRAAVLGLKPKDLVGIPWRVAFALQSDGWYLRSDIVWSKPNPMPESVTDRPTKSHEYVFLLSKRERYYFDADAVREPVSPHTLVAYPNGPGGGGGYQGDGVNDGRVRAGFKRVSNEPVDTTGRNLRSVWTIATQPYPGAHFATFPEALVEPCVKAGSPVDGVVLDCFAGSGTTGRVAQRLGRRAVLIDLSPAYLIQAMVRNRDIPLGLGFGPTEDAA